MLNLRRKNVLFFSIIFSLRAELLGFKAVENSSAGEIACFFGYKSVFVQTENGGIVLIFVAHDHIRAEHVEVARTHSSAVVFADDFKCGSVGFEREQGVFSAY